MVGFYFSQTSVNYFSLGFSCCPYHRVVRYNGVSARRELTVQGEKENHGLMRVDKYKKRYSKVGTIFAYVTTSNILYYLLNEFF